MKTVVDLATALKTYFLEKDTAAKQAVEATIAPVESDASSSAAAYSVGDQLILNDILYDVTASISISDALVVGTNIAAANDLSTQIGSKQDQIEVTSMPTASASNIGQVLIYIGATTSTYTSGQSYQSTLEGGSYIWKPTGSGAPTAAAVSYDGTQSGSSETNVQGAIDDLYSQKQTLENDKQNKTLTTAQTIGGTSRTTVEAALGALSDSEYLVDNLTSSSAVKALTANQGLQLANKHKVTRKTVDTSSWSSDTSSQSGTTLYKKSISLSHVYVDSPSIDISTSDGTGLPTTAQQETYDLLQYVTVDGTTMYLYASAIPTTTFYVQIEGVD